MTQAALRPTSLPRGLLAGTALLIGGTLLLAVLGHRTPVDPGVTGAQPVAQRLIRIADGADGAMLVTDARTGQVIEELAAGSEGFLRGAMRGIVRDRVRAGFGAEPPFRLSAWPDGRLTLEDGATGHIMELRAFGQANAEAFLRYLAREE